MQQEETRGGSRGGHDQFSWEAVKEDRNRICYLGNSVKAPVGRWQAGKDISWFQKPMEQRTDMLIKTTLSSSACSIKEEQELLREKEKEMMANALLYGFGNTPSSTVTTLPQSLINSTIGLFDPKERDKDEKDNTRRESQRSERSLSPETKDSDDEFRGTYNSNRCRASSTSYKEKNYDNRNQWMGKDDDRHRRHIDDEEDNDDRGHGPSFRRRPRTGHDRYSSRHDSTRGRESHQMDGKSIHLRYDIDSSPKIRSSRSLYSRSRDTEYELRYEKKKTVHK